VPIEFIGGGLDLFMASADVSTLVCVLVHVPNLTSHRADRFSRNQIWHWRSHRRHL